MIFLEEGKGEESIIIDNSIEGVTSAPQEPLEEISKTPSDIEPKTFTQEELNKIVQERLARHSQGIYSKLGVNDEQGLNAYIEERVKLKSDYDLLITQKGELAEKLAFIENDILPERYEDVRIYFKGKGIDFSPETLQSELKTHPEWLKQKQSQENVKPTTTIANVGTQRTEKHDDDLKRKASEMFGVDLI